MSDVLLCINTGSSSVKFSLFDAIRPPAAETALYRGAIDGIGGDSRFTVRDRTGVMIAEASSTAGSHDDALEGILDFIHRRADASMVKAVGHRIVHGGPNFAQPVRIDDAVLRQLRSLTPFAPGHQPQCLDAAERTGQAFPSVPQFACFDTAFHATMPLAAKEYALPAELRKDGIRRYGFHGLSYEYIAQTLPSIAGAEVAAGRVVVAHLGSGSSMCAIRGGQSIATTMGLTPLDGLPMAHRSGAIDPGLLLYMLQDRGRSPSELSHLLYDRSGLLGLSGVSGDVRDLLASDDAVAADAIAHYVYWIGRHLGSLVAALGGLDALIFTGGVGEHLAPIREKLCDSAAWLGIALDKQANNENRSCVSLGERVPSVWVIPTDENLAIARHVFHILGARG